MALQFFRLSTTGRQWLLSSHFFIDYLCILCSLCLSLVLCPSISLPLVFFFNLTTILPLPDAFLYFMFTYVNDLGELDFELIVQRYK